MFYSMLLYVNATVIYILKSDMVHHFSVKGRVHCPYSNNYNCIWKLDSYSKIWYRSNAANICIIDRIKCTKHNSSWYDCLFDRNQLTLGSNGYFTDIDTNDVIIISGCRRRWW